MTLPEALTVLFDCGLPLLIDNARDIAKQSDWEGPISEHPTVVACQAAIAVVREAKDRG